MTKFVHLSAFMRDTCPKGSLTVGELTSLYEKGYIKRNGQLTNKGELYLHQLKLTEWIQNNAKLGPCVQ